MKTALARIICILIMTAVLAGGTFLPQILFEQSDRQNDGIVTEELPAVTLDLTKQLSFCSKASLAANGVKTVRVDSDKTSATDHSALQAAENFINELVLRLGIIDYSGTTLFESGAYLYVYPDSKESAVLWEFDGCVENMMRFRLVMDDETLKVLSVAIFLNEIFDYYIDYPMWNLSYSIQQMIERDFDGKWTPLYDEYKYIDNDLEDMYGEVVEGSDGVLTHCALELISYEDGKEYSFRMEFNSNELHFGNTSFGDWDGYPETKQYNDYANNMILNTPY